MPRVHIVCAITQRVPYNTHTKHYRRIGVTLVLLCCAYNIISLCYYVSQQYTHAWYLHPSTPILSLYSAVYKLSSALLTYSVQYCTLRLVSVTWYRICPRRTYIARHTFSICAPGVTRSSAIFQMQGYLNSLSCVRMDYIDALFILSLKHSSVQRDFVWAFVLSLL